MVSVAVSLPAAGSYSVAATVAPVPPAPSTWPLPSQMALWPSRGAVMLLVGLNFPVVRVVQLGAGQQVEVRILPSVAVKLMRGVFSWRVTAPCRGRARVRFDVGTALVPLESARSGGGRAAQ